MKKISQLGTPRTRRNRSPQSKFQRRLRLARIETLESRIVFSHDGNNAINYAMPSDLAAEANANAAAAGVLSPSPFPDVTWTTLANGMPILNSYPSAPATIFLDFDGDPGNPLIKLAPTDPYDIDAQPTTFNSAEQANIVETWRQVSIYFGMFNVNVTTIQPNVSTMPTAWIAIGNNISGAYSGVNVFSNTDPASFQTSGDITGRISATAHELGHNFGSWHIAGYDNLGNKIAEYHDAFDPLHGPIMGLDYQGVIHKWYAWHDSTDVATLQDDMARIAADLNALDGPGDGYKPDDFGGTIATATPLTFVGNTQSKVGVIERLTDADAFSFTSAGGRYAVMVGRDAPSGVDVKVSIYNSAGKLLAQEDGDPRKVPYAMVNDSHLTLDLPAGTFYVVVQSHGNYGDQGQYIVRVDPLPSGWSSEAVGLVGIPGYSNYDSSTGKFVLGGSGDDIWSTADGFQYLYQSLTGDGSITVHVDSQINTNASAKAGIMIRESLDDNSKDAYLVVTPNNSSYFQYRAGTGGSAGSTSGPGSSAAKWLRLTRSGNSIKAEVSSSTSTTAPTSGWTTVGTQVISMASTVYIGMVTSSHNNIRLNTATFSGVVTTGNLNAQTATNNFAAPTGVTITSTTSSSVGISWTGIQLAGDINGDGSVNSADLGLIKAQFGNSTSPGSPVDVNNDGVVDLADYNLIKASMGTTLSGYNIERSTDGINFKQIGGTSASQTSYLDNSGLSDYQPYFYRVRARSSTAAVSEASAATLATTRAGAIGNINIISYTSSALIVDWSDASGESKYRLERSLDGTTGWTSVTEVDPNVPMYVNSGLAAGTKYYYRVVSIDALGDSAISSVTGAFTRLAAPILTFTNKTPNQMAISWPAVTGATKYTVERSNDNTNWTTVSGNQTGLTYTDNNVVPVEKYYYRVTANNPTVPGDPGIIFAASPSATSLPSPWTSTDIGIDTTGGARTGAVGVSGGTVTIIGGGTDIWNDTDQFRFTYVTLSGNGSITARVASIDNTDYYARAGVMIRNSTAAASRFAAVMVHQSDFGVHFQYRTSTTSTSNSRLARENPAITNPSTASQAAPYWVRLTRNGNTFSAAASADGVNWFSLGTQNITLNSTVLVGLALTPRDYTSSLLNKAVLDNVSITFGTTTINLTSAGSSAASAPAPLAAASSPAAGIASAAVAQSSRQSAASKSSSSIIAALNSFSQHTSDKKAAARISSMLLTLADSDRGSSSKQRKLSSVDRELISWLDEHTGHRTGASLAQTVKSGKIIDSFFLSLGRKA